MPVKFPCVCCGHLTMDSPPGSHAICEVCFWEDDGVQLRWPGYPGGANMPPLIESQKNVARFGAMEEHFVVKVRPPRADEPLEPAWRPIDLVRDRFEPDGVRLAPSQPDATVFYWWRYPDGQGWWESV
ncbi:CPCC family cysteine-rich protein [Phytomonospora sp. NPDC050363]|uniref:CPCC family cysteine-rich protein n=1 Tax=Phytomonospora sp. NPDC050363 TaxID=3155642 RepID=UPI0033ECAF8B